LVSYSLGCLKFKSKLICIHLTYPKGLLSNSKILPTNTRKNVLAFYECYSQTCRKDFSCGRPTGQEERHCNRILLHTFIQSCFFLFISPLFISPLFISLSCLYISLVYISPLFISPRTLGLSLFYTLSSHPRTAGHATSPGRQLQIIRAAGAYLHQNGFTSILVHLRSSQDICGLYEEVRCKSYDLAAVPGAFGTAAIPLLTHVKVSFHLKIVYFTITYSEFYNLCYIFTTSAPLSPSPASPVSPPQIHNIITCICMHMTV
jgi:hypothetical protein